MKTQAKTEMRPEKRSSFLDGCRFLQRYNGKTDCMERWIGALGKAKENAKPRSIVAASHVRSQYFTQ